MTDAPMSPDVAKKAVLLVVMIFEVVPAALWGMIVSQPQMQASTFIMSLIGAVGMWAFGVGCINYLLAKAVEGAQKKLENPN